MNILCGTDFSEPAGAAVDVAAAWARATGGRLTLLHAISPPHVELPERALDWPFARLTDLAKAALRSEAARVGQGLEVAQVIDTGQPATVLADTAERLGADLIVLGAVGSTGSQSILAGSVADRCAQRASMAVLAVRKPEPLLRWLAGAGRLHVLAALDLSPESAAVVAWLQTLRTMAPCDVDAEVVAWPPEAHLPMVDPHDGTTRSRLLELERQILVPLSELPGDGVVVSHASASLGRADSVLATLAFERESGLLVVGTHKRPWPVRMWHGSVSRGLLHLAPCSVLVAPRHAAEP
jgi:nucleotide-binding universal stress UspA family protein